MISSWGPKTALVSASCTRLHLYSWLQSAFKGRGSWDVCPVAALIITRILPGAWLKCFSFPRRMLCPSVALIRRLYLLEWDTSSCETGPESHLYRLLWYSSPPVFRAVCAAAAQRLSCYCWGGNSHICSGLNWILPQSSIEGNVTFTRGLLKTDSTYSGVPVCFALLGLPVPIGSCQSNLWLIFLPSLLLSLVTSQFSGFPLCTISLLVVIEGKHLNARDPRLRER